MFKKIFGNASKKEQQNIEKSVEQIKQGKFNKIYPILKPGNWVGIQQGALTQTLLGTPENPKVVIAYGYDTPDNFIFLTQKDLEKRSSGDIINEAYANLENFNTEFTPSKQLNNLVLTSSGHDFSSERILLKSHMDKAHAFLNAEELIVSIPRRRCMMVMPKIPNRDLLQTFINLHKNAWIDDNYGNPQITDVFFFVKSGKIVGSMPMK
ncbi:hypothetical protein [Psychroserpens damuponensis]|uniref:hypothetical protein n=1 Tax=Psychroserpens damuponensis TaxID=943936 RepID=UPI000694FAE7|nr:hypothetical protein [Psychroserpens damuponensis]